MVVMFLRGVFDPSSPRSPSIPSIVSPPIYYYPVIPTASLPPSIPSQVLSALSRVDEWTYDMFELNLVSGGRPLSTLAFALFKRSGIVDLLMLDEPKLARWAAVEGGRERKGARRGGGGKGGIALANAGWGGLVRLDS